MNRVYRNTRGAIVGGVCLGIADYFNVDPTIVRLAWALAVFLGGTGAVAYVIAWIIIPERPSDDRFESRDRPHKQAQVIEVIAQPAVAGGADHADAPGTVAVAAGEFGAGYDPEKVQADAPSRNSTWQQTRPYRHEGSGTNTFGLILILIGAFWLARNLVPHWGWHRFWPFALVALGLYMVITAFRGGSR